MCLSALCSLGGVGLPGSKAVRPPLAGARCDRRALVHRVLTCFFLFRLIFASILLTTLVYYVNFHSIFTLLLVLGLHHTNKPKILEDLMALNVGNILRNIHFY